MGAKYMTFQELLNDERAIGREEGKEELLMEQIKKKLKKNMSIEEIAGVLETEVDAVEKLIATVE